MTETTTPSASTLEQQNQPVREFNDSAALAQLRNEGGSLTPQELRDLKARLKAREELIELERRMRIVEEHERSQIQTQGQRQHQEATEQEPTTQQRTRIFEHQGNRRQVAISSDPSSSSSSDPSSSDSDPDSTNSERPHRRSQRRRKKNRSKGIKVSPSYTLRIDSSLREWGDWKQDVERVFQGDPNSYRRGNKRILKALDYVDKSLKTLWFTYCDQKEEHQTKRWETFLEWTKNNIQNGQSATASLYERYESAKQKPAQTPLEFNAYLASLERDLPRKDEASSALAFYSKLTNELKNQFKTSDIKIPESRSECVSTAQRVWEGLHGKDLRFKNRNTRDPRSTNDKDFKHHRNRSSASHYDHQGRSNSRHRHESRRDRKDRYHLNHRRDDDRNKGKERSREAGGSNKRGTDQILCYNCNKPGHLQYECPEPKKSKDDRHLKIQSTRTRNRSESPRGRSQDRSHRHRTPSSRSSSSRNWPRNQDRTYRHRSPIPKYSDRHHLSDDSASDSSN